jgi:hypothetical protein
MTDSPRPTVDSLLARMKCELQRSTCPSPAPAERLDDVEMLLRAAAERSKPLTELPPQLNRFPFTCRPPAPASLKFLNFLTHDQRAVNAALVQAAARLCRGSAHGLAPDLRLVASEQGDVRRCASDRHGTGAVRPRRPRFTPRDCATRRGAGHEAEIVSVPFNRTRPSGHSRTDARLSPA